MSEKLTTDQWMIASEDAPIEELITAINWKTTNKDKYNKLSECINSGMSWGKSFSVAKNMRTGFLSRIFKRT